MSRNGSGTYSLPAGNPVVSNTTISSSWANTTLSDIGAELTNSLPRDGQAGPTGSYNWNAQNLTNVNVFGALTATFTGVVTLNTNGVLNENKGADIASAATTNIGAATGNYVNVTGTTTITAFDTVQAGVRRRVHFTGSLTLTYNATSLILPGKANIVTAVDDVAEFVSEGSGNWRCLSYTRSDTSALTAGPIQSAFKNLLIVNGATPNSQMTITADEVALESTTGYFVAKSVNKTVSTGSTGANGLDTGTVAASTWYSIWLIYNPTTLSVDSLLSLSATAPTMPSGYTYKARVGWCRTNGSSNLYRTRQNGRKAQYVVDGTILTTAPVLASGTAGNITTPTWVAIALGSFVPPTSSLIEFFVGNTTNSAGTAIVAPNNVYGGVGSANTTPLVISTATNNPINIRASFMLESTNLYWASNLAGMSINCLGWEDNI